MRVRLKGINWVTKRLADGRTVTHYYAWRGGPRLSGTPGSAEFVASYQEAHRTRNVPTQGCLFTLIAEFKASAEYLGLAASTRRAYAAYLKEIEAEFGEMPIAAIESPKARGEFKAWRDRMSATPRRADYVWTTLARVLSVARDRGRISTNPCERGGRLYTASRQDNVWTEADISRVLAVAKPEMELALMLALWTGQRQGDLLSLPWSSYDGTHVRLRQSKTGTAVTIRASQPLRELLARTRKRGPLILTNQQGHPWTSDGFRTSWGKLCARAGIIGLTFHDLRGSAVTRLATAGASVPEIAGVTGHSLMDVTSILDRHYLGERTALAEAAIRKLEKSERRTKVSNRFSNRSKTNLQDIG